MWLECASDGECLGWKERVPGGGEKGKDGASKHRASRRPPPPLAPPAASNGLERPTAWVEGMYEVGVAMSGRVWTNRTLLVSGLDSRKQAGAGASKGYSPCLMGKGEDGGVLVTSLGCQSLCVCV